MLVRPWPGAPPAGWQKVYWLPRISGGVDTKPLADVVAKWTQVTPQRATFYTDGVNRTPDAKFQDRAAAGAGNWAQGVAQAAADNRFATRVAQSGAKWKRKVAAVGGARFSQGVAAAGPDYSAGFSPYLTTLQSLTLSPRGPRGDPRNIQRVSDIATALHAQRRAGVAR